MTFSEMVQGENGLLIKLRCSGEFDEKLFMGIKEYILRYSAEWRKSGSISVIDAVALFDLADGLAGGSIFWDENTVNRVCDAMVEIQDIVHNLEINTNKE